MTTNLASNVVPPAYAVMDAFKMKHRTAVILVGVLAVCTCPWILTNDSLSLIHILNRYIYVRPERTEKGGFISLQRNGFKCIKSPVLQYMGFVTEWEGLQREHHTLCD